MPSNPSIRFTKRRSRRKSAWHEDAGRNFVVKKGYFRNGTVFHILAEYRANNGPRRKFAILLRLMMHNATWRENLPRIHFHQQLAELKDKLLAMAALSQQALESAVEAYLRRDAGICQYVRENETAINPDQRELHEMASALLAKEQPMAIDLRFILAVIKINGDLERIGDQAMSIAIRTREL